MMNRTTNQLGLAPMRIPKNPLAQWIEPVAIRHMVAGGPSPRAGQALL